MKSIKDKERTMKSICFCIVMITACIVVPARTEETAQDGATDLAKKTQNPVADLISLPFQYNTYFETGPKGKTQEVLLVQPVIPLSLNDDWNFLARPIIPLLEQPPLTDAQNRNYGLGNIQFQIQFLFPK